MKKGKKYVAFILLTALLLGVTGFPVRAEADSPEKGIHAAESFDKDTEEWIDQAAEELAAIVQEREIMALVYLSDEYPVRVQPDHTSRTAVEVPSGQLVNIENVYVALDDEENPEVWYYVSLLYNDSEYAGYVPGQYLAVSDERFLEWEAEYGLDFRTSTYTIDAAGNARYYDIEQFPESYRGALTQLKQRHPNWTFVVMNTGLDWNTVISNELEGDRSLVYKTFPDYAKEGLYDSGNWYYASEAVLKQYMDPRNSLTEDTVFQFEQLTYNEAYHTEAAVNSFLRNTFMNDSRYATGTDMTYGRIFWQVGSQEMVSPFHLASRVYQEQGEGKSSLISGQYPGYEGYYNYFNVRASGRTDKEVIENGLTYARENQWTDAYRAILGGTRVIAANYIKKGQDTLYLQKYNVNPTGSYALYTHQYMQNISAPTTEARSIKRLYEAAGALDNTFVFKIPVYFNMPAEACGEPNPNVNGLKAASDGGWYYYVNGQIATNYTGLAYDEAVGWWYVENGKIRFDYNGLVPYGDAWWCVAGGRVVFDYTGLWSDPNVGWWYVENGVINFGYNGLVPYGDAWWCVAGGRVVFDYTGLWSDPSVGWWYVENGAINFGYNGLIPYGDAWWCVAGGGVVFDYTGLWSDPNVGWWYVENGVINFGYNGLIPYGDAWWCVAGGSVIPGYTGLWSDPNVGWWYVENGTINFGYTGLVEMDGIWWYVQGGQLDFGYSGYVTWYDVTYTVINGQVV